MTCRLLDQSMVRYGCRGQTSQAVRPSFWHCREEGNSQLCITLWGRRRDTTCFRGNGERDTPHPNQTDGSGVSIRRRRRIGIVCEGIIGSRVDGWFGGRLGTFLRPRLAKCPAAAAVPAYQVSRLPPRIAPNRAVQLQRSLYRPSGATHLGVPLLARATWRRSAARDASRRSLCRKGTRSGSNT